MRFGSSMISATNGGNEQGGGNAGAGTTGYAAGWTIFAGPSSSTAPSAALFAAHGSFAAAAAGAALFAVSAGPCPPSTSHLLAHQHGAPTGGYFDQTTAAGNGGAATGLYGANVGPNPYYQHYQPSSLASAHQIHHHQGGPHVPQSVHQIQLQPPSSMSVASPPTTFILRQPPGTRKSLSPDISVDEEAGEEGGGPGGQQPNGGGGSPSNGAQQPLIQQQGHTARTPPETLEWLKTNYEPFKGASLPRCALYEHYQSHCREAGLVPVNAASFGKLIRSVFKDLDTRRLGTRGNSKYHYDGIRAKLTSKLGPSMPQEDFQRMNSTVQQSTTGAGGGGHHQRSQRRQSALGGQKRGAAKAGRGAQNNSTSSNSSSADEKQRANSSEGGGDIGEEGQQQMENSQQMGAEERGRRSPQPQSSSSSSFPEHQSANPNREFSLPEVKLPTLDEGMLLQFGLSLEISLKFFDDYREHCREMLECVKNCRLELIEGFWAAFWRGNGEGHEKQAANDGEELGQLRGAPLLDQGILFRLCSLPPVLAFVEYFDLKFYQLLLDLLFPSPLRLSLPGDLCNRVRHLGKSVECWMEKALGQRAPPALRRTKIGCVRLLANSLTRLSSFAHLAITARNVLQNEQQVQQMHEDFNRVDFGVVHWQADWLCSGGHCPPDGHSWVRELVAQFRDRLGRQCSLEDWADWLEGVAERVLAAWAGQPPELQMANGKRFLLGWTFHSSLLLRDITLRSAQSFGQFHLVRLLFDDYLLLTMEHKLAKLVGRDPISLMAPEWLLQNEQIAPLNHQGRPQFPQMPHSIVPNSGQQHFYGRMQQRQSQQSTMVDQLPPPGPEPPFDMLNGIGDEQQDANLAERERQSSTATIQYVRRAEEEEEEEEEGHGEDWEMVEGGEGETIGGENERRQGAFGHKRQRREGQEKGQ